jgi:hypothetical protein
MDLAKDMTTLAQHATSPIMERRPQLGDIIIHNYGALVYIGTIERFCTHNANMVEGPALVVSSDDGKFYECQASPLLRSAEVQGGEQAARDAVRGRGGAGSQHACCCGGGCG